VTAATSHAAATDSTTCATVRSSIAAPQQLRYRCPAACMCLLFVRSPRGSRVPLQADVSRRSAIWPYGACQASDTDSEPVLVVDNLEQFQGRQSPLHKADTTCQQHKNNPKCSQCMLADAWLCGQGQAWLVIGNPVLAVATPLRISVLIAHAQQEPVQPHRTSA
jgi:hypothetical protein